MGCAQIEKGFLIHRKALANSSSYFSSLFFALSFEFLEVYSIYLFNTLAPPWLHLGSTSAPPRLHLGSTLAPQ